MRHRSWLVILLAMLISFTAATGGDQPLPKDAELLIKEFEEQVDAIERKAEADIREKQQKLTERLQVLRDNLIKDGNLDEALDVHQVVKQMKVVFVEVEWNETWYAVELLETRDDGYLVAFPNNEQRQTIPKDHVRHPYHRRPTLKGVHPARETIPIHPREKPKDDEGKE